MLLVEGQMLLSGTDRMVQKLRKKNPAFQNLMCVYVCARACELLTPTGHIL